MGDTRDCLLPLVHDLGAVCCDVVHASLGCFCVSCLELLPGVLGGNMIYCSGVCRDFDDFIVLVVRVSRIFSTVSNPHHISQRAESLLLCCFDEVSHGETGRCLNVSVVPEHL